MSDKVKRKMSTFVTDTAMMGKDLDFNALGAKVLEEIKNSKPRFGKDSTFAPMLEKILNAALEREMDAHLTEKSRQSGNRRYGRMDKQVKTPVEEVIVSTPRDRDGSFDPQFIKKR